MIRPQEPWLEPILIDYVGRDGSTLLMRLLATSASVAVEPDYPFEQKYFTYLWRWSHLLDRIDGATEGWNENHMATLAPEPDQPMLGAPIWWPRAFFEPLPGEPPMSDRAFELLWSELSRRAAHAKAGPTGADAVSYYAEKHIGTWRAPLWELPPLKVIALVRDPRDVWVSIQALNRKRAETGERLLGIVPGESEQQWLDRYVTSTRERCDWLLTQDVGRVVSYERLIGDLDAEARALSEWLGIELDPDQVRADVELPRRHGTSGSPVASVGRWRTELDPARARHLTEALGPELRRLGYER